MIEAIKLSKVSKSYNNTVILNNVNLTVNKGATVGIIGPNACGKSVLFKLICGFEKPNSGEIFIRKEKVGETFDFPSDVGIIINEVGYIGIYSGFKNLQYLAEIRNKIDDNKIKETMEMVGLDPNNKTKVKNYSLGMKQKLGIAQAIMENQDILILDEPFNALDYKTNKEIKNLLIKLKNEGRTIMITSHNHNDIEELCSEIYIIDDGELLELTEEKKEIYFNL